MELLQLFRGDTIIVRYVFVMTCKLFFQLTAF